MRGHNAVRHRGITIFSKILAMVLLKHPHVPSSHLYSLFPPSSCFPCEEMNRFFQSKVILLCRLPLHFAKIKGTVLDFAVTSQFWEKNSVLIFPTLQIHPGCRKARRNWNGAQNWGLEQMLDSCMHLSEVKQILNVTAWKWRFSAPAMLVILQVLLVSFISLDAPDLVCSILKTSLCRNSSWALIPLTALSKTAKWPKICPSVCFAYCLRKKEGGTQWGSPTLTRRDAEGNPSGFSVTAIAVLWLPLTWPPSLLPPSCPYPDGK